MPRRTETSDVPAQWREAWRGILARQREVSRRVADDLQTRLGVLTPAAQAHLDLAALQSAAGEVLLRQAVQQRHVRDAGRAALLLRHAQQCLESAEASSTRASGVMADARDFVAVLLDRYTPEQIEMVRSSLLGEGRETPALPEPDDDVELPETRQKDSDADD